jgi:hypothetical protein
MVMSRKYTEINEARPTSSQEMGREETKRNRFTDPDYIRISRLDLERYHVDVADVNTV